MKKIIPLIFFVTSAFLTSSKVFSQTSVSEAQAIFIYNFTRLIEWPSNAKSGDFVIGVFGSTSLYGDLKNYMSGKTVGTQNIVIKKISSVDEIGGGMQILFVAFGKTRDLPQVIQKIGGSSTMVITERSGGIEAGATINFVLSEDKLKYEFKASNATKIGLKYNSNLEMMSISKH